MSDERAAREHGDGLVPGARIEEFEIVRELGFGGFGITYLARDHALARLVAVKEYFPGDWGTRRADGTIAPRSATAEADYAWGLERFVDEARVLARLTHHNIVKVHRIVAAAGSAYMAMEYVEGHSLADELKSLGPLSERRVRRLLAGLAEGLAAVHAAGLLHRDIKPANVMLREGDGSPVLIDFGAARQQMGRQSRSITAVLTPGYAPIEQYSSKGRQGPWTDLYALGAVAYAALSGRVPDDATERMLEDELAPVETVAASPVGAELAGAVMTALEVYPDRRPRDVSEWLAVLRGGDGAEAAVVAARGVEPVAAEPAKPARQRAGSGPKPSRRRAGTAWPKWRMWAGGGAGAAAVVALLVWLAGGGSGGGGGVPSQAALPDPDSLAAVVEEALGLERSEVQRIQRGLLEAGFDPGEGDGLIGVGTREAMRRWQTERGFETTGYLGVDAADVLASAGLEAFRADSIARADAEAQRAAEATRQAEERRLAAERAEAARQAEERRLAADRAEAARQAEERRLAAERSEAARQAEERRLAADRAEAARQAEERRLAADRAEALEIRSLSREAARWARSDEAPFPASAQTIDDGDTEDGSLRQSRPVALFFYRAVETGMTQISVDAEDDTRLIVRGPMTRAWDFDLYPIAEDDDSGRGFNPEVTVMIRERGVYLIILSPYEPPSRSIDYEITVTMRPSGSGEE